VTDYVDTFRSTDLCNQTRNKFSGLRRTVAFVTSLRAAGRWASVLIEDATREKRPAGSFV